ncbi:MAG: sigma 54-interacting transcriptional regulator [Deltaproteobacteria bacterium]|nr:sigma 54-interacting transcriptional regulator [Deltaproteobacteria bacterium]
MAEIAFFRHGEELLRVALSDRTVLGRAADCDVSLPDPAVSRAQARVERRGDGFWLVDTSGRGTRLGGREVREAPLEDGAEISLGAYRALFRAASGPGADATLLGETRLRPGREGPVLPARLRVREKGRERAVVVPEALTVGKDPGCDVVLDDAFVSARHLRLERRGASFHLRDLGSTNGTFVGGARVTDAEWLPGTAATLGETELVLEAGAAPEAPAAFEGMLSADPAMRQLFELLERVAPSDTPVTILGETGTGKELVARALHRLSQRRDGAFIPVNCSAIAESLIESELFGHEKGAFSGADRLRKGAFEEADRGTLFLDEIGELPLDLQPKLLRALEQGEVKRVGAARPFQVNVRVLAATHRDLRARVRAGKFREDLYYRLCVVPLSVPPLRARRGDVRALAETFLQRAAPQGLPLRFADEALARLEGYDWPGNVRQLRNAVQRALLFRGPGLEVPASAVTFEDTRHAGGPAQEEEAIYSRGLTMEEVEREAIRLSLRRNGGNRAAVVRELQIAKSTVLKRIGQWGLHLEGRPPGDPPPPDDEAEGS